MLRNTAPKRECEVKGRPITEGLYANSYSPRVSDKILMKKHTREGFSWATKRSLVATLAIDSLPQLDCKGTERIGERGSYWPTTTHHHSINISFHLYSVGSFFISLPFWNFFCFFLAFCFFHAGNKSLSLFLRSPITDCGLMGGGSHDMGARR